MRLGGITPVWLEPCQVCTTRKKVTKSCNLEKQGGEHDLIGSRYGLSRQNQQSLGILSLPCGEKAKRTLGNMHSSRYAHAHGVQSGATVVRENAFRVSSGTAGVR